MKTIGYVLAEFPVLSQTFVGNEMRAMRERGHKVVPIVIRRHHGPAQTEDLLLATEAFYLENTPNKRAYEELRQPGHGAIRAMSYVFNQQTLSRYSLLGNALKIASIARAHGCDHLHAHFAGAAASHAIVAARWMGATVSFTGHGTDVNRDREDLDLKLDKSDLVVGVCHDMVDEFAEKGPVAQLAMVPCGTNPDRFQPANKKSTNGRLLYMGRLSPSKGVDDLIDASARLGNDCPMIDVVGDGPLADILEKRAADCGLLNKKIHFLGSKSAEWIANEAPYYQAVVLPFKTAADGQRDTGPVVIKEAMAMGLPVLSTRMTGIKDTITAQTGFLVEPANVLSLAQMMLRVAQLGEEERFELGKRARARVNTHFTIEAQARALSALIETLGTMDAEESSEPGKPRKKSTKARKEAA